MIQKAALNETYFEVLGHIHLPVQRGLVNALASL